MPPARRKGYTYVERPDDSTWVIVRDRDGQGIGAFASNPDVYAAIAADRDADVDRTSHAAAFRRTHLDEKGPDLRVKPGKPMQDGTRRDAPSGS